MSVQRTRQVDTLQRIMTSFKHFERKLDKLQEDVSYHGQTLSDLRVMMTNLSTGTITNPEVDDCKRPAKRTTAIQYDDFKHMEHMEGQNKARRKLAIRPLPNKLKAKHIQNQKVGNKLSPAQSPFHLNRVIASSPKPAGKHTQRPRKAEAPRKATILRAQKAIDKKRNRMPL